MDLILSENSCYIGRQQLAYLLLAIGALVFLDHIFLPVWRGEVKYLSGNMKKGRTMLDKNLDGDLAGLGLDLARTAPPWPTAGSRPTGRAPCGAGEEANRWTGSSRQTVLG